MFVYFLIWHLHTYFHDVSFLWHVGAQALKEDEVHIALETHSEGMCMPARTVNIVQLIPRHL